jgi:hypothetical protein
LAGSGTKKITSAITLSNLPPISARDAERLKTGVHARLPADEAGHITNAGLNRENVPAFRGRSGWHHSAIQKILSNQAVLGWFQPHRRVNGKRVPDGNPIPGYYPAVIDEATFWRAHSAVKARSHGSAGRSGSTYSNLTKGLGICSNCGGKLVFIAKGRPPKGGRYLTCGNARRGRCDNKIHYRYDGFENQLLSELLELNHKLLLPKANQDLEPDRAVEFEAEIAAKTKLVDGLVQEIRQGGDIPRLLNGVSRQAAN